MWGCVCVCKEQPGFMGGATGWVKITTLKESSLSLLAVNQNNESGFFAPSFRSPLHSSTWLGMTDSSDHTCSASDISPPGPHQLWSTAAEKTVPPLCSLPILANPLVASQILGSQKNCSSALQFLEVWGSGIWTFWRLPCLTWSSSPVSEPAACAPRPAFYLIANSSLHSTILIFCVTTLNTIFVLISNAIPSSL